MDAYEEYILIHDKGTRHFEDLSFTLPNGFEDYKSNSYFDCVANNNMWCCIRDYQYTSESNYWSACIYCGKKDEEDSIVSLEYFYSPKGNTYRKKYCLAYNDNAKAKKFCSKIGSYQKIVSFHTPVGLYRPYYQYEVNK